MSWVGVAVGVGGAVVGAYSSNKASKNAAQAQGENTDKQLQYTKEATEQARKDIARLYPEAQAMMAGGFGDALGVFRQALPQQASVFQQGNVGAQQALMSGLQQQNNAILGGPIDYSSMQQPVALDYNMGLIANQQLPQAVLDSLQRNQENQQQAQLPQPNITPFQAFQNAMQQNGSGSINNLFSPMTNYRYNNNGSLF